MHAEGAVKLLGVVGWGSWSDLRWVRDMNQVDQSNPRGSGGSKQFLTEFLGPVDLMSRERMVVLATGQGKAAETATRFTCDRRR